MMMTVTRGVTEMSFDHSASAVGRVGHLASTGLIVSILAAIAVGVAPPPAGSATALLLPLLLFSTVIMCWMLMRSHDRRLCEQCARSMPLNAAKVASTYGRRFALAHAGRRTIATYLVVLIASNLLLVEGGAGRWAWAAVQSSMIYLVLAYSAHRRFQPWCPACRNDGGGQSFTDAPDPIPSGGGRNS
jgi:hypothetical protein